MFCDSENYTSAPPKYSPCYNFDYHFYAKYNSKKERKILFLISCQFDLMNIYQSNGLLKIFWQVENQTRLFP